MSTDQAASLRSLATSKLTSPKAAPGPGRNTRVIAVTSGKGGVGKTNTSANLAFVAAGTGKKVLVIDADIGLANLDITLGITPKYHMGDVLRGTCTLKEVIIPGPNGMWVIPGGSGLDEVARVEEQQMLSILGQSQELDDFDIVIIDTGAGISELVLNFLLVAHEIVIVTTPEPTAFSDAYAVIKHLTTKYQKQNLKLLVNMVKSSSEGQQIHMKMNIMLKRFIQSEIAYLGSVSDDAMLRKCVRKQKLVCDLYPASPASKNFQNLAQRLFDGSTNIISTAQAGFFSSFFERILSGRRS
ncbi:MinD/ParA family protein [Desulfurispirillum indicum]|uniref:NifH/FrxC:cobyrinic acid a,c-diamide synthase n=1 Tax=Desulfurispirillum indicum (strain ATCC BAA-1389 / DSM 22839 / S5) TaxID=653733 RepID=E6W663_DESIS|nr:MinD/ParA family protein [Desulfurispirillum indicum]ADU66099.1 NifH/FrxC:cobyrinic acid a,c-diamide synthase [Desulfurispirillum indicum S5]UCZ55505.1 MinD/ParA family protein [Desulfurispirillum indicum]